MFVLHPSKYARDYVRVFNFRDWFGVSSLYCTLQSTLETKFRVFNFRDGLGFHVCIGPLKVR